jgi:hypothetical protein
MVLRVAKTKHVARRIANEYLRRHRPRGPVPRWAEPPCTLLLQSWFSGSLNLIIQLNCSDTSQYTSGCPLTDQLLHRFHPDFPFCLPSHPERYPRVPARHLSAFVWTAKTLSSPRSSAQGPRTMECDFGIYRRLDLRDPRWSERQNYEVQPRPMQAPQHQGSSRSSSSGT